MKERLDPGFGFSQSSLAVFDECRRRFFLRYVQGLVWPAAVTGELAGQEEAIRRGQRFHQLIQQDALGLEVDHLVAEEDDPDLQRWWRNYRQQGPAGVPSGRIFSEVQLSVPLGAYRLVARFDRVVLGADGTVWILDWKTGKRRPEAEAYAASWQTRVYCYVLVEAGGVLVEGRAIAAEQVRLLYWHAEFPGLLKPQIYSPQAHVAAAGQLARAVEGITGLAGEGGFPQTEAVARCGRCQYRGLCQRGRRADDDWDIDFLADDDLGWDLIPEADL
ncbi:MAG: hypothetical protein GKR89_10325 [Candidatus Latescibacteria bacterium]|nr:hypothetical protein [Candidatus Latescibacterota bacterium]